MQPSRAIWFWRLACLVMACWAVYRHFLTPEWTMRSSTGFEFGVHSWFWRAPDSSNCTPVGINWLRSLFMGGSGLLVAVAGLYVTPVAVDRRHPNKPQQPASAPSGARG